MCNQLKKEKHQSCDAHSKLNTQNSTLNLLPDNRQKVLVSACLLGVNCRYNAEPLEPRELPVDRDHMILVCPEQAGGLKAPRKPCWFSNEKSGRGVLDGDTRIINEDGEDKTEAFLKGAQSVLKIAIESGCKKAFLKERSPSCGVNQIYLGKDRIAGKGVACTLLEQHGIECIGVE